MPKNLFFANWPVNTLETTANLSLRQKLSQLAIMVDDATQFLTSAAIRIKAKDPIYVLTLPEYYFVKGISVVNNRGVWELYDSGEKDSIYACLLYTSPSPRD